MVQMVFVHGVATRSANATYDIEQRNREKLFKEILFDGKSLNIRSPCWGDLVPKLSRDGQSFAKQQVTSLGIFGGGAAEAVAGSTIAELAAQRPATALDAIYATMVDRADQHQTELTADDIAAFKAVMPAVADPAAPPKLPASATDEELIFNLAHPADGVTSFGIGSWIQDAVTALADRARNTVSTGIANAALNDLNPLVGRFLGDIFVYLKTGDVRNKIRACIRQPIIDAHADAKAANEPLILMGHSLGGVILYDMLSSPQSAGLPDDLEVAAFVTVGSQPGLFEEMGLFESGQTDASGTPGPDCATAWLNVFDPIDVFGFRTKPMFTKPNDYAFDSVTGLLSAHTTYFKRPQFYARMRARLHDIGLV